MRKSADAGVISWTMGGRFDNLMNMYIHLFNDSFISRSDYINKVSTDKTPVTRSGNPGLKGTKKQK